MQQTINIYDTEKQIMKDLQKRYGKKLDLTIKKRICDLNGHQQTQDDKCEYCKRWVS